MKTVLERLKVLGEESSVLQDYVVKQEIVAPRTLPSLALAQVPFIGYAPIASPEQWVAQRKEATHTVEAYLVLLHTVQESAILGSDQKVGLLDFVANFEDVVRGSFLPPQDDATDYYLSKPLDITGVDYETAPYGDNFFLLIATVSLRCVRLFAA